MEKSNVKNPSIGRYSRGRRNVIGEKLGDFCNMHSLFITNGAFQNPAKHMSTWQTKITKNNEIIKWYNQIDCTLC